MSEYSSPELENLTSCRRIAQRELTRQIKSLRYIQNVYDHIREKHRLALGKYKYLDTKYAEETKLRAFNKSGTVVKVAKVEKTKIEQIYSKLPKGAKDILKTLTTDEIIALINENKE